MLKSVIKIVASGLFALVWAAAPAGSQIYKIETGNLELIYYSRAQDYLIPHTIRCFENSLAFHSRLFNYEPSEKIVVVLQDFTDHGGAGASAVPDNGVSINIAPFSYVYETRPANERMNWVLNHELVHVLAGDKASGSDEFFRAIFFGKVQVDAADPLSMFYSYLTSPRWYAPRWYHEGIAVFMETWMAGGLGRALGPFDEMFFRTMIRDSAYIYNMVGLVSEGTAADFQVGAVAYLYGTRFFSYLALQYGPMKLLDWVSRTGGTKGYFATQFTKVYGVSPKREWNRWIEWEHAWQDSNLASIRRNPVTGFRPIAKRPLGSVSRAAYDSTSDKLYTAVLYPGEMAHLAEIDMATGETRKVCNIQGPALYYVTSLAYDISSGTAFFTEGNNAWRDLVAVDVESGDKETLIKDLRMGSLAFNGADRSVWGVRHFNGISTLTRVEYPYDDWDQVHSFPYGTDIFDLDISPDGSLLTCALTHVDGTQHLIKMQVDSLLAGNAGHDVIFDFEVSSPANFVFTPDGKYIYGSSYYTGVSNIYRYNLEAEDMEIISNCETGFFRPTPVSGDSLAVFRYTSEGFVPVLISTGPIDRVSAVKYLGQEVVEEHPVLKDWIVTPVERAEGDTAAATRGEYHVVRGMRLSSMYPILQGYKDYASVGLRFNISDKLGMAKLKVTGAYSPTHLLDEKERVHLGLQFDYWGWRIGATYNHADFYDLFGPTKTSRKGYSWGLAYRRTLQYSPPKTADVRVFVAGFGDLETMPRYQNVLATYDKFISFGLSLGQRNMKSTLGSVDYEQGYSWEVNSVNNYVSHEIVPRVYGALGLGFPLPLDHAPVWLWSSAGYSWGNSDDSFANFYFGGFGNNWVDYQSVKRYRQHYAFPGVEINEIGGTNYCRLMVEWILPPLRFKRIGLTSAYLRWARLSVFSTGIVTNMDDDAERRALLNVGGQIDIRLVTFSLIKSTLSAGYAAAFEGDGKVSEEWMLSLKLL
jgi:hypothetical protein